MCGIVGFFGKPSDKHTRVFSELLHVDIIRGPHSTGVAVITKKKVPIVKGVVTPAVLLSTDEWKAAMDAPKRYGMIGHNRFATKGAINGENAHPFKVGKITGVHNGTTSDFWFPKDMRCATDSETLMTAIDKEGPEWMWDKVSGAAALVWWNAETKTLNMLRNGERPLWIAPLPKDEGIFFASEPWMLRGCMYRHELEIEKDTCIPLTVNTLHTFKYDASKQKVALETKPIEPYKITYVAPKARTIIEQTSATSNVVIMGPRSHGAQFDIFTRRLKPEGGDSDGERLQGVTQEDFRAYYARCYFCGCNTLEYDTMQVLDADNCEAICEGCQETAALNGINPAHVH